MRARVSTDDDARPATPAGAPIGDPPGPALRERLLPYLSEAVTLVRGADVAESLSAPGGVLGHGDQHGHHALEHAHPDDLPGVCDVAAAAIDLGPGTIRTAPVRLRRAGGSWAPYEITITNRTDDPHLAGLIVRTRPLDRVPPPAALDTEGLLQSLADAMSTGVILLDRFGNTLFANAQATATFAGLDPTDALAGSVLPDLFVPEDRAEVAAAIIAARSELTAGVDLHVHVEDLERGRRLLRLRLSARQSDGRTAMILVNVEDVTEQHAHATDLAHRAAHDFLTGLPNRAALHDLLGDQLAHDPAGLVLFYCDIDGFKGVNDRHGHDHGDRVIMRVAEDLRLAVREEDVVARLGGDEFVVVCRHPSDAIVRRLAERLSLAAGWAGTPSPSSTTVSVGWARGRPGDDVEALLVRADEAMYAVKRARRDPGGQASGDQSTRGTSAHSRSRS